MKIERIVFGVLLMSLPLTSGSVGLSQTGGPGAPGGGPSATIQCYLKTDINCDELNFLMDGEACQDKVCTFVPVSTILDCSIYDDNGGIAEGQYNCPSGTKELVKTSYVGKQCANEAGGDGFHRTQETWFCLRERECSLSCERTSTFKQMISIYCIPGYWNDGTPKNPVLRQVKEYKGVCKSLGGGSGENFALSALEYFRCLQACSPHPGAVLPGDP